MDNIMTAAYDPFSMKGRGWGYFKIDPTYSGMDFREDLAPIPPNEISDLEDTYFLCGVLPESMFKPGTEPEGFKWYWFDNSMMPWLRHRSPSNPLGDKMWGRVTYCGWGPDDQLEVHDDHRLRVNDKLNYLSGGSIKNISEIWGGIKPTGSTVSKALIIPSSEQNFREFYDTTVDDWVKMVTRELDMKGLDYVVRLKEWNPDKRVGNQVADQMVRDKCDFAIGNHTAALSEVVVMGYPVITTSKWNPALSVSTPWESFCDGNITEYNEEQIDKWVTMICGYTYYRTDVNTLGFLKIHPSRRQ